MVTPFDRETHADIGAKKSSALTAMKNGHCLCISRTANDVCTYRPERMVPRQLEIAPPGSAVCPKQGIDTEH
jgi:hypothetical protein